MELVIDGRRVAAGSGGRPFDPDLPSVVLLHGAGMDHTVWAMQARALAHHGRNVFALDLPGHGGSDGPALDGIAALADWVLVLCAALPLERFRLAGHSMGALVAYETALRLTGVRMLVVTGHGAPHLRPTVVRDPDAPAAQLVEQLRGLGGLPERVLADGDLLDLVLPVFRADLAAATGYTCDPDTRLTCPVHALAGADDPLVGDAGLAAWGDRTTGATCCAQTGERSAVIVSASSRASPPGCSAATRPSRRKTTRSACAAALGSCVTTTTVSPRSASPRRTPRTSSPLSVSRLPVGSSASRTLGEPMSARAIATRCCWPPESSDGRRAASSSRPTVPSSSSARSDAWRAGVPAMIAGKATFSAAVSVGRSA
jgi:surfactin synthase thioesterase subunit